MEVEVFETETELVYRVSGVASEAAVLKASFFSEDGGVFTKSFPRKALMFDHDPQVLARNFRAHLREQANPEKAKQRFEKALDQVCRIHEAASLRWWLAGSGALFVRGLDVTPHDIDVMTYATEIPKLPALVGPWIVEPFHHVTGWVVKGFGVINLDFRIDYALEPEAWVDGQGPVDFGPQAQGELEEVHWKGHSLWVPPISYHLGSNRARGRHQVVEQIELWLAKGR